jgi:hypothetical protein
MNGGDSNKIVRVIADLKSKVPFDPFRIVTTKGDKFLVAKPDLVMIVPGIIRVFARSGHMVQLQEKELAAVEELKVMISVG